MMMRVNAVIISRMAGSSVSAVISIRICSVSEYVWPPPGPVVTVSAGMPGLGREADQRREQRGSRPTSSLREALMRFICRGSSSAAP